MERIHLDLPVLSSIPDAYLKRSADILKISGHNLGNFAFRHALRFIVRELPSYRQCTYADLAGIDSSRIRGPVIISCANWLSPSESDDKSNARRAEFITQLRSKVLALGLGCQGDIDAEIVELGSGSQKLIRVLSERSALISVRDHLTRRTLSYYGVQNVAVTGCPSNFINPDRCLGQAIQSKAATASVASSWGSLRVGISELSGGHPGSAGFLALCLRHLLQWRAAYVIQSPVLLPFLLHEKEGIPDLYARGGGARDRSHLEAALRQSVVAFSSVDTWLDHSRFWDLSFGMRIHGTVVPMQAGIPSLLVVHDSRTKGLADVMSIPRVVPEQFAELYSRGPCAIIKFISDEMRPFDTNRERLASTLCEVVESAGLEVHSQLLRIAGRES